MNMIVHYISNCLSSSSLASLKSMKFYFLFSNMLYKNYVSIYFHCFFSLLFKNTVVSVEPNICVLAQRRGRAVADSSQDEGGPTGR